MLNLPFYKNPATSCMQVCMKIVCKHFLGEDIPLEKMDALTGRTGKNFTWTSQMAHGLDELGLNIKFYSRTPLEPFLGGESFIREHFGNDARKILSTTDVPVLVDSIKKLTSKNIFEHRRLDFSEIEQELSKGHVPIILFDHNIIIGKQGHYHGHCVVLTKIDDKHVYYHESGPRNPEPHKKVDKKLFIRACNANGTDNDVVIVFGKK